MRIGILGTRGIPANYGGFETFAEELGARLAERGHEVTVYGRAHHIPAGLESYRGVRIVILPTVRHKYLDTVVHTLISMGHAVAGRFDVLLVCNAANALFCGIPQVTGVPVALNVDGVERKRAKWNALGRAWYHMSERLAVWFADRIVTDARVIHAYYKQRYDADTTFIPYGCDVAKAAGHETLGRFGLTPGGYVLYVSRLEPENNALAVIEGFERTRLDTRLVIVGDAPYAEAYKARLRAAAGPRVVFTGGIYGDGYRQLQSHAWVYVHATEVGGTHPALVEAMGYGNCVLVNDVPENREVVGDAGLFFEAAAPETLAALFERVAAAPEVVETYRARAVERARSTYSWSTVADAYETLLTSLGTGAARR